MTPDFSLSASDVNTLRNHPWVFRSDDAVFRLTGPGTIDCLQGVLTNDIVKAGPQALVWGALLTPKGMIITDLWVKRDGADAWLFIPRAARDVVKDLFKRSFPPRLTKVSDISDTAGIHWLVNLGDRELADLPGALVPHEVAPFSGVLLTQSESEAAVFEASVRTHNWSLVGADFALAQKALLQWPTLGREINEKTLVQEVRFDELRGVKYDKGCFTGQETVARLHFRGHANKELRHIELDSAPTDPEIRQGDKVVGRITTWGLLGEEIVAIGVVRRKD